LTDATRQVAKMGMRTIACEKFDLEKTKSGIRKIIDNFGCS
jgi:hypothetical protein